jgi:hypothetical protein
MNNDEPSLHDHPVRTRSNTQSLAGALRSHEGKGLSMGKSREAVARMLLKPRRVRRD